MLIRIDTTSPVPLGEQVAASVRGAIAGGSVGPGERLPPARELAASLGINLHTVLRGYQQLRDEGLVELRRGRGAVVTEAAAGGTAELTQAVRALAGTARRLGLSGDEVLELVRRAMQPG